MKAREAKLERWWRRPSSRRAVAWGITGFLVGSIFVLVMLLLFGPQPGAVQSASPTGSAAISVTMNDTFLSQQAAAGIKQANLPIAVTNIQTHIEPGNVVRISGDTGGLPSILPNRLSATGQLYVQSGQMLVTITQANVGGIPLPGTVTTLMQDSINTQLAPLESGLLPTATPYQITSVSTKSGLLTINFNPA